MKIRLMVSEEHYAEIADWLTVHGAEIDDAADFILSEKNAYASHLIGRNGEDIYRLRTAEISHIESYAHDIIAYCGGVECKLSDPLRRLEEILDPAEFIRVSNSAIVAINHIKSIRPTLGRKFILTMSDGARVDVTRTYYYIFKDTLGI